MSSSTSTTSRKRVLTVGETMVLFDPLTPGEPTPGQQFELRIAGSESNFAIGLQRLGVDVTWVSRLGADAFGSAIWRALHSEGVDLRYAKIDPRAPTGIYFKWREAGRSHVSYYREHSAATFLTAADIPGDALNGVHHVHLTGITMGLSQSARHMTSSVAKRAREAGLTVSFDPNWRPALWSSSSAAAAAYRSILPYVDWVLCGLVEANELFGTTTPTEVLATVRQAGAANGIIRVGSGGAVVSVGSELVNVAPPRIVSVVDEVGAGDAFAAGFVLGLLEGFEPEHCAHIGNVIAAHALGATGDWETLPSRAEVQEHLDADSVLLQVGKGQG